MKKVLLVDDLPANLYLLQVLLTHHGFEVETASDGAQALARARQSPPDLIVTDILMPVMDGFALCRQWKADAGLKHIPLVFYTATYTDAKDEQFALDLGADAFLVKPAELTDFMACVNAVLTASAARAMPHPVVLPDEVLLKEYNQVLVHKLEQKLFQLEKSEKFNRTLFEHSPIGLALCRLDGTLLEVNPAYARILGRSVAETLSLSYWQVTPEQYAPQEAQQRQALERSGQYGPCEKEYIHADGHRVPVRLSGFIVERGGERLIWSGVEDITAHKQAELALRQSEERFRLAAVGGDVWSWDIGGNKILFPVEFWRRLGYQEQELDDPAARFESVLHPDDLASWRQAVKDHLSRRRPYALDYRARTKTGEYRWFHTSGQARWNAAGRATYMAGTTFDITERKRAELALRQSEERFRLAASSGDVWGWDIGANQFSFSGEFWRKLGYAEAEIAEPLRMFESVLHPGDLARWRQAVKAHISRRSPYELDIRMRTKAGEYRWFHTSGQARWDDRGRATYMAGTTFDITERKRAEAEILQLNAELEQRVAQRTAQLAAANRELETFAYSVSHDLKAPLRGIDGYSQLLQQTCSAELGEDGRLFIDNIRHGADQMSALIDDLLAYSRMERRPLHNVELNLVEVVQSVLAERSAEIQTLGVVLQWALPPLSVQADLDGLAVVLRNLLENALKFSRDAKPPALEIGGREESNACILWLKDNGIGFDMKFHDRIFDIFQRLQRAEDYPGTGIGLALVAKAMQRMGGRAWAHSAPGQGATFFLELPKYPPPAGGRGAGGEGGEIHALP